MAIDTTGRARNRFQTRKKSDSNLLCGSSSCRRRPPIPFRRSRFLTMPSSPKLSGVPEYGLAVFLDVLIEPNAGGRWPISIKTDRKGERSFCATASIMSYALLGGLHHCYVRV